MAAPGARPSRALDVDPAGGGNTYVEVADNMAGVVTVRGSKAPEGLVLAFFPAARGGGATDYLLT